MDIFLRAKHWQLFLLTFAIPFLLQIVMMFGIFSDLMRHPGEAPDFAVFTGYFKLFPFIMLLSTGTLFGWQFSVVTGLQKMVPAGIKMKVTKFKTFFFIPLAYLSLILIFVFVFLSINFSHSEITDYGFYAFIPFLIIFPIHLFAMFCIFYCLYFEAKTIKTVELQREVSFSDFVGEFFLIWFFFVGVWILQPKINKMVAEYLPQDQIPSHESE